MMVNQRRVLLYLIGLTMFLGACVRGEQVAVHTAVPTPQPTLEPTVTETAVSAPTTAAPVQPTVVPTIYAYPYPSSQPIPNGPYQLEPPRIPELMEVYAFGQTIANLVDNDLNNHYAENLNSFTFLNYSPYPTSFSDVEAMPSGFDPWWLPGELVITAVRQEIALFLQQELPLFTPQVKQEVSGWSYIPYPVDIDGDGQPEWLLEIEIPGFNMHYFDLFKESSPGSFSHLSNETSAWPLSMFSEYLTTLNLDDDLTGDNLKDIVIAGRAELPAGGFIQRVEAYTWNGDVLQHLNMFANYEGDLHLGTYPELSFADFTGDGIVDIRVSQQFNQNFDCVWDQTDIFSWQGLQSHHQISEYSWETPPDELMCNIRQATLPIDRVGHLSAEEKILFLERSVADMPASDVSPDLFAYVLTQLAWAHLSLGHDLEAQQYVNQVIALADDSNFALFVQESFTKAGGSLMGLCRQMRVDAQTVMSTDIGKYVGLWVIYQSPEYGSGPYLPFVCDIGFIAENRLVNATFTTDVAPPVWTTELGLIFAYAQELNLDSDLENEWFGILEPSDPRFVIVDAQNGFWNIEKPINHIFYPVEAMLWVQKDLTGDSFVETVLVMKESSGEDLFYQLEVVQATGTGFEAIASKNFDETSLPSLDEINPATFNLDAPPNWRILTGFPTEKQYLTEYVSELQTAVLTQTDPTVPEKITQLLTYLPSDDPDARPYIEHLTYLLGYFYELSGDEETAVSTYLDLIQRYPTSPWSWLAWARLEPVEN